jgi:hypothetical protein
MPQPTSLVEQTAWLMSQMTPLQRRHLARIAAHWTRQPVFKHLSRRMTLSIARTRNPRTRRAAVVRIAKAG